MQINVFQCSVLLSIVISQSSYSDDLLDETRSAIQEWVRTEQLVSLEKQQWAEEKSSISDILTILSAEQRELNEQIALAQEVASRADEERAALVEQLSNYQGISGMLEARISGYERQLALIAPSLPDTLRKELAPRLSRIDSSTADSVYSLSERTQTVLNIMSEIESFDTRLTLVTEIIDSQQSEPIEVRVLYFGLSRAFYVNDNATAGGYGIPAETGWQWQLVPELSESVARAMDIHQTRITPQLISLPMQVVQ